MLAIEISEVLPGFVTVATRHAAARQPAAQDSGQLAHSADKTGAAEEYTRIVAVAPREAVLAVYEPRQHGSAWMRGTGLLWVVNFNHHVHGQVNFDSSEPIALLTLHRFCCNCFLMSFILNRLDSIGVFWN